MVSASTSPASSKKNSPSYVNTFQRLIDFFLIRRNVFLLNQLLFKDLSHWCNLHKMYNTASSFYFSSYIATNCLAQRLHFVLSSSSPLRGNRSNHSQAISVNSLCWRFDTLEPAATSSFSASIIPGASLKVHHLRLAECAGFYVTLVSL